MSTFLPWVIYPLINVSFMLSFTSSDINTLNNEIIYLNIIQYIFKYNMNSSYINNLDYGDLLQSITFLKNPKSVNEILEFRPDLIIVAGYGLILPKEILDFPPLGCINIHPSILPKYRGPSPVSTAILNGDSHTGVTLMMMNEGLDSGPIIDQKIVSIDQSDRNDTLTEKLFLMGSDLLKDYLMNDENNLKTPSLQDDSKAVYTALVVKQDG